MRYENVIVPPIADEFRAWLGRKGDALLDLTLAPESCPLAQWLTERNGGLWLAGPDEADWWRRDRWWPYPLPPWARQFQEWLLRWYAWLAGKEMLGEAVRAGDLLAAWQAREGYTIVGRP